MDNELTNNKAAVPENSDKTVDKDNLCITGKSDTKDNLIEEKSTTKIVVASTELIENIKKLDSLDRKNLLLTHENTSGELNYQDSEFFREFDLRPLQAQPHNWEPSAVAMEHMNRLVARSPIIAVCSRFEPGHLGYRLLDSLKNLKNVWHISPTGACVNGDIEPLFSHLREGQSERTVYQVELNSFTVRFGASLLSKLLDQKLFDRLAAELTKNSAMLLIALTHTEDFPFQYVRPEHKEQLQAACNPENGWIYEASWQREMPRSWLLSPIASAANDASHFVDRVEDELTTGQRLQREHRLYSLMETFSHEWVWRAGGGVGVEDLVDNFNKALQSVEADGSSVQTWVDGISVKLARPPQEAVLEKLMITIAVCSESDWPYSGFRRFGGMALWNRRIVEEVVKESEEVLGRSRRTSLRVRKELRLVPADTAWSDNFDHLVRALGLVFRVSDKKRIVQFKDPFYRLVLREWVFTNFPSLVQDLADRLLQMDALFHTDSELRKCTVEFFSQLDAFDPDFVRLIIRKSLNTADNLMGSGASADSLIAHVRPEMLKGNREHVLCILELFDAIARNSSISNMRDYMLEQLLDDRFWQRSGDDCNSLLLRTEVLVTLSHLEGLDELKKYIDDADERVFQPLLTYVFSPQPENKALAKQAPPPGGARRGQCLKIRAAGARLNLSQLRVAAR